MPAPATREHKLEVSIRKDLVSGTKVLIRLIDARVITGSSLRRCRDVGPLVDASHTSFLLPTDGSCASRADASEAQASTCVGLCAQQASSIRSIVKAFYLHGKMYSIFLRSGKDAATYESIGAVIERCRLFAIAHVPRIDPSKERTQSSPA